MIYASVLQHYIYTSPEKSIHVWIQAPAYIFVAFSEAFIIITGLELAFTHAPKKYALFIRVKIPYTDLKQSSLVHLCAFLVYYRCGCSDLYCTEPSVAGSVSCVDVCRSRYHGICSWVCFLRMLSQVAEIEGRRRYPRG